MYRTSFTNATLGQFFLRVSVVVMPEVIQVEFSLSKASSFTLDPPLTLFRVQRTGIHFYSADHWYVPFLAWREWQRLAIAKFFGSLLDSPTLRSLCCGCNVHCAAIQIPIRGWISANMTPRYFVGSTLGYSISFTRKNSTIILSSGSSRLWTIRGFSSLPFAINTGGQTRRRSCGHRRSGFNVALLGRSHTSP